MMILLYFLLSLALIKLILALPEGVCGMDVPNHRSLHQHPIPRIGGLAIVLTTVAVWLFSAHLSLLWLGLFCAIIALGLLDDLFKLSVVLRMTVQLVLAYVFARYFLQIDAPIVLFGAIVSVVWLCNLYNFMDGADGLAGGMAVFGFSTYALAGYFAGNHSILSLCTGLVAANMAFLYFNFNPARIFMGDAGSLSMGFLAATLGLYGFWLSIWPWWLPIFAFSPFVADATATLLKRALRGEKVWQAHRSHYYQRLIQMGWSHRKMALVAYVIMLFSGTTALIAAKYDGCCALVLAWLIFYALAMRAVDARWVRFLRQSGEK